MGKRGWHDKMKKNKIIGIFSQCMMERRICRIYVDDSGRGFDCFPLKINEHFLLGERLEEFAPEWYCIRSFQQMKKVRIGEQRQFEPAPDGSMVVGTMIPNVDIKDWRSIFRSLRAMACNVIIEYEGKKSGKRKVCAGRIEKGGKRSLKLRRFGADGVCETETTEIAYEAIIGVTFGAQHTEIFSEYML